MQHQVLICWFSVESYENTFVIVRTCLYSNVLTLDFHSECFTSTVHVFTCQAVPCQTVWIIYHSPQLCWLANTKINLFFLSTLAPDRAPTILSVTPHTTTSVLVRWQVGCCINCFVNRRMNVKRAVQWPQLIFILWLNIRGSILGINWALLFAASLGGSPKWSPVGVQGQVPGVTLWPAPQLLCPHCEQSLIPLGWSHW